MARRAGGRKLTHSQTEEKEELFGHEADYMTAGALVREFGGTRDADEGARNYIAWCKKQPEPANGRSWWRFNAASRMEEYLLVKVGLKDLEKKKTTTTDHAEALHAHVTSEQLASLERREDNDTANPKSPVTGPAPSQSTHPTRNKQRETK